MSDSKTVFKKAIDRKKQDFPGFSFRWMAQQLDMSHTYLHQIVAGSRPVPVQLIDRLCEILDIDSETRALIYQDVLKTKSFCPPPNGHSTKSESQNEWRLAPKKDFDLLLRWETLPVLWSTLLVDFDGTPEFIARKLNLNVYAAATLMKDLEERGYLRQGPNGLEMSHRYFEFQSKLSKEQIRNYHKLSLERATKELSERTAESDVEKRLMNSSVFTCKKSDVPLIKSKISQFLKELIETHSDETPEEIYQFSLQFFPISEPTSS